jgi:FkbM family methyltransferase
MRAEPLRRILRRLRRELRILRGTDLRLRPEFECPRLRLGSRAAGWWLCPEGLGPDSVVYSFGIGTDVDFDLALIDRFGLRVHAFDPTPASLDWLRTQDLPEALEVHPFGLADRDGAVDFHPPARADHVSHSLLPGVLGDAGRPPVRVPVRRLSTLMATLGHHRIDLLKLDIEGAEYAALEDVLAAGLDIRQILVEYHHRFPGVGPEATRRSLALLRWHGFRLFAVSGSGEECSLLRHQD